MSMILALLVALGAHLMPGASHGVQPNSISGGGPLASVQASSISGGGPL